MNERHQRIKERNQTIEIALHLIGWIVVIIFVAHLLIGTGSTFF